MTRERMLEAREHILNKRYSQARAILNTIDHPKAKEWLERLDDLELGDPFQELARAQAVPAPVSPIQPITPPRNAVQAKRLLESAIATFLQNNWRLNYSTENTAQLEKKIGVDGCLGFILIALFSLLGSAIVCLMIAAQNQSEPP